jgi:hypothetical protein
LRTEIATPERFSVQARNDRKDKVALLLAMAMSWSVIACMGKDFEMVKG